MSTLQNLLTFAFVLTSMLSMGLSLTISDAPLNQLPGNLHLEQEQQ